MCSSSIPSQDLWGLDVKPSGLWYTWRVNYSLAILVQFKLYFDRNRSSSVFSPFLLKNPYPHSHFAHLPFPWALSMSTMSKSECLILFTCSGTLALGCASQRVCVHSWVPTQIWASKGPFAHTANPTSSRSIFGNECSGRYDASQVDRQDRESSQWLRTCRISYLVSQARSLTETVGVLFNNRFHGTVLLGVTDLKRQRQRLSRIVDVLISHQTSVTDSSCLVADYDTLLQPETIMFSIWTNTFASIESHAQFSLTTSCKDGISIWVDRSLINDFLSYRSEFAMCDSEIDQRRVR